MRTFRSRRAPSGICAYTSGLSDLQRPDDAGHAAAQREAAASGSLPSVSPALKRSHDQLVRMSAAGGLFLKEGWYFARPTPSARASAIRVGGNRACWVIDAGVTVAGPACLRGGSWARSSARALVTRSLGAGTRCKGQRGTASCQALTCVGLAHGGVVGPAWTLGTA